MQVRSIVERARPNYIYVRTERELETYFSPSSLAQRPDEPIRVESFPELTSAKAMHALCRRPLSRGARLLLPTGNDGAKHRFRKLPASDGVFFVCDDSLFGLSGSGVVVLVLHARIHACSRRGGGIMHVAAAAGTNAGSGTVKFGYYMI